MSRPAVTSLGSAAGVLATLGLGVAAGAMLAEGAVLVPWWRSMPPEAFLRWYADNARRLLEFYGPLEIVGATLTLLRLVVDRFGDGTRSAAMPRAHAQRTSSGWGRGRPRCQNAPAGTARGRRGQAPRMAAY